nr:caspase family protein [Bacteroidota bacterium]
MPKKVTVILDACFSGGGRNQGLLAAKGVKVKPKENLVKGSLVVFAASSSDQESLFYEEEQHGLFTYYLLKKLKETKGEASYKEMYDYLKIKVPSTATDKYYKEQNPNMNVSSDVESEWKVWKFK